MQLGIRGVKRGRRVITTRRDDTAARSPDLVKRNFTATRPNQLWVTDLTYVPTWSGVAYTCFIVDAFSRMIVGWRVASTMRTEMVLDALEMARWSRGTTLEGLVAHSDAGSVNSRQFATASAWPRSGRCPRSAPSATPTTMLWPRRSTPSTRPSSSGGPDRGRGGPSRTWNSPPSGGSTGTTTSGCTATSNDVPPAEFEAAYAAQQTDQQLVGIQ